MVKTEPRESARAKAISGVESEGGTGTGIPDSAGGRAPLYLLISPLHTTMLNPTLQFSRLK
jgi:hypothetical protein